MIFALILTPVIVIIFSGGFVDSLDIIKQKSIENLNMFKGLNIVAIMSLMAWGLGYFGQLHILARFMAADSHHTIVRARRISMTWMILCLGGAAAVGFFGIAYFTQHLDHATSVNQNGERVFIELAQILFNPWVAGILLSAILAAVMSTLSCQLLVCSSTITEDLYKAFFRTGASQRELVLVGRLMVLIVAQPLDRSCCFPFSVMWSRMTRNGALVGMIIGVLTVIVWKQFAWFNLYEIILGFVLGSAPSATMQTRFNVANAHYYGPF